MCVLCCACASVHMSIHVKLYLSDVPHLLPQRSVVPTATLSTHLGRSCQLHHVWIGRPARAVRRPSPLQQQQRCRGRTARDRPLLHRQQTEREEWSQHSKRRSSSSSSNQSLLQPQPPRHRVPHDLGYSHALNMP